MTSTDPLADIAVEGREAFEKIMEETPTESPAVNDQDEVEPEEGDDAEAEADADNTPSKEVPFHEHPRWKQREAELNELREQREEDARIIAELQERTQSKETDTSIPDWFIELYGENATAWAKYQEHDARQRQEIKNEIIRDQEEQRTRQTQEADKWQKWVDEEIGKLEADGKKFDKNKLIKTMLEFRPTDENNNFDFQAGYRIYEALESKGTQSNEARKELADTVNKPSKASDPVKKDYMTPSDLRGKSWNAL